MRPNRFVTFGIPDIGELSEVLEVPIGTIFDCGMNPYTGNVVFSFQDTPEARFFSRIILGQLADNFDLFDEESFPVAAKSDLLAKWRHDEQSVVQLNGACCGCSISGGVVHLTMDFSEVA